MEADTWLTALESYRSFVEARPCWQTRTIYEYFAEHLGGTPGDDTLYELTTEDGCGKDCRAVIDAAEELMKVSDSAAFNAIRVAAFEAVEIYWHG